MADAAVIFDVDGVLLELTRAEEDAFFLPFERRYGLKGISRDWNSYAIRNDENIIAEILARHGLPEHEHAEVVADYLDVLKLQLADGTIETVAIPGAPELLQKLEGSLRTGIATANLLGAAELRLKDAGLWDHVSDHARGADGGGHKREILARALATTGLPSNRIVYIGDNPSDVEAGLSNGVNFIGFSTDSARLTELERAGAFHTCNNHLDSFRLIGHLLQR
ncbi:MAG: HAD-IA family hydrolase [Aestuariivirga sp.]|nr:HAD-IA family hydrolase [Aestuariivirga sp.]